MNNKEYNQKKLKILKFYEKHKMVRGLNYYQVKEYCENELELREEDSLFIMNDLYEEGLITKLFSITYGAQGDMAIYIEAEPSRLTKLGRMALEDDKIYNKILKGSKKIVEIISGLK